jgi:hypothetical protein
MRFSQKEVHFLNSRLFRIQMHVRISLPTRCYPDGFVWRIFFFKQTRAEVSDQKEKENNIFQVKYLIVSCDLKFLFFAHLVFIFVIRETRAM